MTANQWYHFKPSSTVTSSTTQCSIYYPGYGVCYGNWAPGRKEIVEQEMELDPINSDEWDRILSGKE